MKGLLWVTIVREKNCVVEMAKVIARVVRHIQAQALAALQDPGLEEATKADLDVEVEGFRGMYAVTKEVQEGRNVSKGHIKVMA
jgi:hypothetical protein